MAKAKWEKALFMQSYGGLRVCYQGRWVTTIGYRPTAQPPMVVVCDGHSDTFKLPLQVWQQCESEAIQPPQPSGQTVSREKPK